MYIYIIENNINGKVYIGQTIQKNPYGRWRNHISESKKENSKPCIVDRAIKKYGENNFTFTIIEYYSTQEELNQAEIYWIAYIRKTLGIKKVYNLKDGGAIGIIAPETRLKISIANMGRISPFKGAHHSEENKNKMSKIMTGKFVGTKSVLFGTHRSEEDKEKISKTQRKLSDEDRANIIKDYETGDYSYIDLAKKYGVSKWPIGRIITTNANNR